MITVNGMTVPKLAVYVRLKMIEVDPHEGRWIFISDKFLSHPKADKRTVNNHIGNLALFDECNNCRVCKELNDEG